jgi:hypothetical protein
MRNSLVRWRVVSKGVAVVLLPAPPPRVGAVRAQQDRHDPGRLMVAGDRFCQAVCGDRSIPTLEPCVSMEGSI